MRANPLETEVWLARGLLGLVLLVLAWRLLRRLGRALALAGARRRAAAIARAQLPALLRRRAQLVQPDPYGKPVLARWEQELAYFVREHVAPALSRAQSNAIAGSHAALIEAVASVVDAALGSDTSSDFPRDGTPAEFERFCAEALRSAGWEARATPPGRDQGADVIAEKDGQRLVLQCKLHSRKIGNRAVQEVVAARAHEGADLAAVVSNQAYTASAVQLAATNRVLLLHYSELGDIEARWVTN